MENFDQKNNKGGYLILNDEQNFMINRDQDKNQMTLPEMLANIQSNQQSILGVDQTIELLE